MAVVMRLKNGLTIVPECQFNLLRFEKGAATLSMDTPCSLCLTPYEGCNTVDKLRTFTVPLSGITLNDIIDPANETWLLSVLTPQSLTWENITGCHWTSEIDESESVSTNLNITFNLTITDDTPGVVDYSLAIVVIAGNTELDGEGPIGNVTVTYTLADTDPWFSGEKVFTTAASEAARTVTFDAGPPETMIFPSSLSVTAVDP